MNIITHGRFNLQVPGIHIPVNSAPKPALFFQLLENHGIVPPYENCTSMGLESVRVAKVEPLEHLCLLRSEPEGRSQKRTHHILCSPRSVSLWPSPAALSQSSR